MGGKIEVVMILRGSLDEFAVLVELGGHAHVAELVADGHHHAADNGRVNLQVETYNYKVQ